MSIEATEVGSLREEVARAIAERNWRKGSAEDIAEMAEGFLLDADAAIAVVIERAAKVAENLDVCTEWWEGHKRAVRDPSPIETAHAIRALAEPTP